MIKIRGSKMGGYILGMTKWEKGWMGSGEYEELPFTKSELKAIWRLLDRRFKKNKL